MARRTTHKGAHCTRTPTARSAIAFIYHGINKLVLTLGVCFGCSSDQQSKRETVRWNERCSVVERKNLNTRQTCLLALLFGCVGGGCRLEKQPFCSCEEKNHDHNLCKDARSEGVSQWWSWAAGPLLSPDFLYMRKTNPSSRKPLKIKLYVHIVRHFPYSDTWKTIKE